MSKQSSIDWFHEKTWELKMLLEKQQISIGEYGVAYYDIFQEAKEMHKEEIIEANIAGMEFIPSDPKKYTEDATEYYKDTFA